MSPADKVQKFIRQMLKWEASFHTEKKSGSYKDDPEHRNKVNNDARYELRSIFSDNLSERALSRFGAARLETLSTSRPPEYDQVVLKDTEERSGEVVSIETVRQKGLKQRYCYTLIIENGDQKIDGVSIWRASTGEWQLRNAI